MMDSAIGFQWILVIVSSILLFVIAPFAKTSNDFFKGSANDQAPSFWMLTSSLVISWIFAKSITNAANLGLSFGIVGGFAYAAYYLSFIVAGLVIYSMRTKGGFNSIPQFLASKFGKGALIIFSILIAFRLFNEVWSNTMIIGSYFGDKGSFDYFLAILVFTILTLAYTLKGGLRSSLLTDLIQFVLFGFLLFGILAAIIPKVDGGVARFISSGSWTMAGGLNLLFVALIQVFSYPFHDPVLTDRAFIADPKTTLKSFFYATFIGAVCILLFSFVGIYAQMEGLSGQAPVEVAKLLGLGMMLAINFIMITSAASTLDSTFNSFAKLAIVDLGISSTKSISLGRWAICLVAVLGTIPVFFGPEILSATTVSGTMVIGLAPIFIFWNLKAPAISFYLSVGIGLLFGIILTTGFYPSSLVFTTGKYADLLSVNLIGSLFCLLAFFIPILIKKLFKSNQSEFK